MPLGAFVLLPFCHPWMGSPGTGCVQNHGNINGKSREFQLTGGYIGYQWVSCFFLCSTVSCPYLLPSVAERKNAWWIFALVGFQSNASFSQSDKTTKNNSKSRWPWRMERMPPINSQQTAVLVGFHATLAVEKIGSHQRNKCWPRIFFQKNELQYPLVNKHSYLKWP